MLTSLVSLALISLYKSPSLINTLLGPGNSWTESIHLPLFTVAGQSMRVWSDLETQQSPLSVWLPGPTCYSDYTEATHPVHRGLPQLRGSDEGRWVESDGEGEKRRKEKRKSRSRPWEYECMYCNTLGGLCVNLSVHHLCFTRHGIQVSWKHLQHCATSCVCSVRPCEHVYMSYF